MNLDEIKQQLQQMTAGAHDDFANAANYILQVIDQAQSGAMSPSETAEVLHDIQSQLDIIQDEQKLAFKEQLNTIIKIINNKNKKIYQIYN